MPNVSVVWVSFCTFLIWLATVTGDDQEPVVRTSLGSIQGKLLKTPEDDVVRNVHEFLGIPYAQPPIGKLRFRKPEPVQPWEGIYKATTWSDICVQTSMMFGLFNETVGGKPAEDCLYLNIWTPVLPTNEQGTKKAVMVFIHGGAFKLGAASQLTYHGAMLSSMGDVVVVTINYRLGILGFLNVGTDEAPGNQAFWDQRLALIWVQEHIEHFGGDPNLVTIFGESAGSMSVGAQLLSSVSGGLFKHAIMQSGSPINPGLLGSPEMAHTFLINYATEQGCYNGKGDTNDENVLLNVIECLRETDVSQIIKAEDDYNAHPEKLYVYPTSGDEFLPNKERRDKFETSQAADLLIGFNPNEGTLFLIEPLQQLQRSRNGTLSFTVSDAKQIAKSFLGNSQESLINSAIQFYFDDIPESIEPDKLKQITSDVFGDFALSCPAEYFAEYFSRHNPVYFYQYSHRHSASSYEEWVGVTHADELTFIFGASLYDKATFTEEEKIFYQQIVHLWTTFAKTGKPQFPGFDTWPLYSEAHPVYVDLKLGDFRRGIGPRLPECNFWRCQLERP